MTYTKLGSGRAFHCRRSFTLVELLIVTAIITLLASTVLYAMHGVQEDAREKRTETQIIKIHELIAERWRGYQTRKLPLRLPPADTGLVYRSIIRLQAMREVMRMELPDRITDLLWTPTRSISPPSLWRSYRRKSGLTNLIGGLNEQQWLRDKSAWPSARPSVNEAAGLWSVQFQGAECLHLILSSMQDGDRPALEFFKSTEIGDVDGDGQLEVLDAWGRPIEFLRWAPGFVSELQSREIPDDTDPFRVDWRWEKNWYWNDSEIPDKPFTLFPLIYSAGRDGEYQITVDNVAGPGEPRLAFADPEGSGHLGMPQHVPNDPYLRTIAGPWLGAPTGSPGNADNISNHLLGIK